MSDAADIHAWARRLRHSVTAGHILDLTAATDRALPAHFIRSLLLETGLAVDPKGLQIHGARITGTLDFDYATLPCRLEFAQCSFDNTPSFNYSKVPNLVMDGCKLPGLLLKSAQISGSCDLANIVATGKLDLEGIRINGLLDLTKAKIANMHGHALALDSAEVDGDVFLDRLIARGEIRALGARFGGAFFLGSARLANLATDSNPKGHALFLDNVGIRGNAFFSDLYSEGEVRAIGAHFGSLILKGARLNNRHKDALTLDRSRVDINASFVGANICGTLRAVGFECVGQLDLTEVILEDPKPEGGAAVFFSATIGTLNISRASAQGGLNLSAARVGVLSVGTMEPAQGLPMLSGVRGWSLGTIDGFIRTDVNAATRWLDSLDGGDRKMGHRLFSVQPWKEMAKAYDQLGQTRDSRMLRYRAEVRATKMAPPVRKLFRGLYGLFVGYGYRPFRVLGWIFGLYIAALVPGLVQECSFAPTAPNISSLCVADKSGMFESVRASSAVPYPAFNPWLFAVDATVPSVPGGQSSAWRAVEDPLPAFFAAIKGLSWVLAALLLAGITAILRKD